MLEELDCEGSVITIDAMGCQKAIVEKIAAKKADYLIALKGNQGGFCQQISEYVGKNKTQLLSYTQRNKDHIRGENRVIYVAEKPSWLDTEADWKNLNTLVLVEYTRIANDKETVHRRLYISSLTGKFPEYYAHLI